MAKKWGGCPIGLNCENMGLDQTERGREKCQNWSRCNDLTMSWSLPYEYDDDGSLVVRKNHAPQIIDKNGEERFYDDWELHDRIRDEWSNAGWESSKNIEAHVFISEGQRQSDDQTDPF